MICGIQGTSGTTWEKPKKRRSSLTTRDDLWKTFLYVDHDESEIARVFVNVEQIRICFVFNEVHELHLGKKLVFKGEAPNFGAYATAGRRPGHWNVEDYSVS